MAITKQVIKAMQHLYPLRLADTSFDNVGLLSEAPFEASSKLLLLTIDLTPQVAREALQLKPACVIAYHPVIFKPVRQLSMQSPLMANLLRLSAQGTSVYCPHTAVDAAAGGMNDWLADQVSQACSIMGSKCANTEVIKSVEPESETGRPQGYGRLLNLTQPVDLNDLARQIKHSLGLTHVQLATGNSNVRSIALCPGSGSSIISNTSADLYLTGEMSHHEVLAAVAAGSSVLLTNHSNSERGYLEHMKEKLKELLPHDVDIQISQADADPLQLI